MNAVKAKSTAPRVRPRTVIANIVLTSFLVLSVSGCMSEHVQGPRVAGWVTPDPSERHPIIVSQQPATLALRVPRGTYGLTPQQRAQLFSFADRYRARDTGNGKLLISAPSGSQNEVEAMETVREIRHILREAGFAEASIGVEAYRGSRNAQPPVRISYLQFVAEAPECGHWGSNLAEDPMNVGTPNLGCATQANLAAMVSNPADLLGPRTVTPRASEYRDQTWAKHVKGESTIARKQSDERVSVQGSK